MDIRVQSYSGHRGEETPRFLLTENHKIRVKKILDRWLAPDHRYFKLIGEDDALYIIRHDQKTWNWELSRIFSPALPHAFRPCSDHSGEQ
jgi:hypothetical protein